MLLNVDLITDFLLLWCSMTNLNDFKDFFDRIIFIKSSFKSSSWCFFKHSFSFSLSIIPLAVILIVIFILDEFIPFTHANPEHPTIYFSIRVCLNSITIGQIILILIKLDLYIRIFYCHVTFSIAIFVLPQLLLPSEC